MSKAAIPGLLSLLEEKLKEEDGRLGNYRQMLKDIQYEADESISRAEQNVRAQVKLLEKLQITINTLSSLQEAE